MLIAIIGAGRFGKALARALVAKRYQVRFGVPDPARHAALPLQFKGRATVSVVSEAIDSVAIVILATAYAAALQVARDVPDWRHRIVVDATNPVAPGMDSLLVGTVTSGVQQIALLAHQARVVEAFNSTGFENLAGPRYPAGSLFVPVAGDDAEARQKVITLATLIGFEAVDLGKLTAARYIEPWAMVWIEMAMRQGHGRRFGFIRSSKT